MGTKKLKFIDLFAGIGGTRIGLEQAAEELGCKVECVFTSEINSKSRSTYVKNFSIEEKCIFQEDITLLDKPSEIKLIPSHDLLLAGFPCQAFSLAGKRKGFEDTRGTLFYNIMKVLKYKKPKFFMLENVANLVKHDKGKTIVTMLKHLRNEGYEVPEPKILNAKDFGLPQNRRRVFIVGSNKKNFKFSYPEKNNVQTKVKDILEEGKIDSKYTISAKLWQSHQLRKERNKKNGKGFGYQKVTRDSNYTATLSARYYKDGAEILLDRGPKKEPRKLTPRECSNLQGFPKDFILNKSDNESYKQFGNSVPVPVVKAICLELLKNL
ncbi:DNA (cytosine-5-)-methyltransferase [Pelagibacterales bacterium]|nr:DNA (cytosine-5-)-methyltransferase [Pelagibacterales bacterium]